MADRIVLLNDGVIQQDDKPVGIYQQPANQFVAGFVGSPSINFIPLEMRGDVVRSQALDLTLSPEQLRTILIGGADMGALPDGNYVCGIRPEHIKLNSGDGVSIGMAQIQYVERLGSETLFHDRRSGKELVILLPGLITDLKSLTDVDIVFEANQGHLFAAETDARVS